MMAHRDDNAWNDDALKRILEGPLEGDASWAEPGDRVWEGVSRSIGKRKKKRRALWWWFGGLAVLLTVAWLTGPGGLRSNGTSQSASRSGTSATDRAEAAFALGSSREVQGKMIVSDGPASSDKQESSNDASGRQVRSKTLPSGERANQPGNPARIDPEMLEVPLPDPAFGRSIPATGPMEIDTALRAEANPSPVVPELPALHDPALPELAEPTATSLFGDVALSKRNSGAGIHRLSLYAHGTGAGMDWRRRRNLPGPPMFMEDPVSQRFESLRLGLGWEWQYARGWFLAGGLEFQSIREETERSLPWRFTRKGGMPRPGGFNQDLALSLSGGFGNSSADLRVSVRELQNTQDYQEGDSVQLSLMLHQQLRQVRVPLMAGYRVRYRRFFGECRLGIGLQFNTGFEAELTRLSDDRNRLGLLGPVPLKRSPQLADGSVDVQAGAALGFAMMGGLEWTVGWDGWRGIGPAVRLPSRQGFLQGSGVTASLRWQLPRR